MKVIFLDIDGVLNSKRYDNESGINRKVMDPTRLDLLRYIVDETEAEIVLSSSWRQGWSKSENACSRSGKMIYDEFVAAHIDIYDKTPYFGIGADRSKEIKAWLEENPPVESFVILDDIQYGWGDLEDHVVRTRYDIGRGLEEKHVKMAISILNAEG